VGDSVSTSLSAPSLSRDDQRVALYRGVNAGNPDIWVLEAKRGVFSRFTSDAADDVGPIWSPDGDRIVFSSNRKGVQDLYQKSVTAGVSEELLLATAQAKLATDWSGDGHLVLFTSHNLKSGFDIWALLLDGNRKPFPVVQTGFDEQGGQFSPDGHWIAYQSDESGRAEIYVQRFPDRGNKWQISTNGGSQVRWRRDGRELFYVALDGRLMAVAIGISSNAQAPDVGTPVALFVPPLGGAVQQGDARHQYMVASDGQRFLVATVTEEANSPITVILNWKPRPNHVESIGSGLRLKRDAIALLLDEPTEDGWPFRRSFRAAAVQGGRWDCCGASAAISSITLARASRARCRRARQVRTPTGSRNRSR
jgi:dipeptidyl aminopeptidase/acylaminoacyl peptidase